MAQAIAFLVRHRGQDFRERDFWDLLLLESRKHSLVFHEALLKVRDESSLPRDVSGYVTHTVPAAFRYFISHRYRFEEAIVAAASAGGDTDSLAAMVGTLAGAYLGSRAIPEAWRIGIRDRAPVERLASELFELATRPSSEVRRAAEPLNPENARARFAALLHEHAEDGLPMPETMAEIVCGEHDPMPACYALQAIRAMHEEEFDAGIAAFTLLGEYALAHAQLAWQELAAEELESWGHHLRAQQDDMRAAQCLSLAYERFATQPVELADLMVFAGALGDAGLWAKGVLILQEILSGEAIAEHSYEEWLRAAIYLTMGNLLDAAGDLDGAIAAYETCAELALADDEDPDTQHAAAANQNAGSACMRHQRWQQALEAYERALALEEDVHTRKQLEEVRSHLMPPASPPVYANDNDIVTGGRLVETGGVSEVTFKDGPVTLVAKIKSLVEQGALPRVWITRDLVACTSLATAYSFTTLRTEPPNRSSSPCQTVHGALASPEKPSPYIRFKPSPNQGKALRFCVREHYRPGVDPEVYEGVEPVESIMRGARTSGATERIMTRFARSSRLLWSGSTRAWWGPTCGAGEAGLSNWPGITGRETGEQASTPAGKMRRPWRPY